MSFSHAKNSRVVQTLFLNSSIHLVSALVNILT